MGKAVKGIKGKRIWKILIGAVILVVALLLAVALAGVYAYWSGERSLRGSADTQAPKLVSDAMERQRMMDAYEQNAQKTLAWEDDWVVYEGEIFEYKDDCLNFLLMGIDRMGKIGKKTDLSNWSAGQADTIFVVSLDVAEKKVSIVGLPRNTMVELEVYGTDGEVSETMYNQICLQYGYAGGGELGLEKMKERVAELFSGLPIHGVCAIGFDSLKKIADVLGGIEVTVPEDTMINKKAYAAGEKVLLTRSNIIPYLRYRDVTVLGSPTTRLTRQKEFLKIAVARIVDEVKKNPLFVKELYEAVLPYMNTDITLDEAVYLAAQALDYTITDGSFYQLTGEDRRVDFEKPKREGDFYDDLYLDEEYLEKVMMEVFFRKVVVETGRQAGGN